MLATPLEPGWFHAKVADAPVRGVPLTPTSRRMRPLSPMIVSEIERITAGNDRDVAVGIDRRGPDIGRDFGARAAEDQVGAVRTLAPRREPIEIGAAADNVVLAQPTKGDVVAAAALDIVIAVAGALEARIDGQSAGEVRAEAEICRVGRHRPATGGAEGCEPIVGSVYVPPDASCRLSCAWASWYGVAPANMPIVPSPWMTSLPSPPKISSSPAPPAM